MSEMHSVGGYWVAQHRWERKCQWGQSRPDRGQSAAEDLALFAPPLAGSGFSSFLHLGRWPQGQSPRLNPLPGLCPGWFRRGLSPLPPPRGWACLLSEGGDQHRLGSCGDYLPRFGQQGQPPALSPSLSQRLGLGLLSVEAPL